MNDLKWPQNYFLISHTITDFKSWFSQNLLAISCEKLSGILKIEFRFFSLSIFGALFLPMMSLTAAVHFRLMWYFVVVQNELGLDLPSWVQYYKNAWKLPLVLLWELIFDHFKILQEFSRIMPKNKLFPVLTGSAWVCRKIKIIFELSGFV